MKKFLVEALYSVTTGIIVFVITKDRNLAVLATALVAALYDSE